MERGNVQEREWIRRLLGAGMLVCLLMLVGCTRGFYRRQADRDVHSLLAEKDRFAKWKIEHYHVYPDPRSRFADAGKPDRPPMPPDDPAARLLAPAPQKPGKAGVAWVEGTGYLNLMAFWDTQNRAERALLDDTARPFTDIKPSEIRQAAFVRQEEGKEPKEGEGSTPPRTLDIPGCPPPFLLKLDQAVELGLINSREFQTRREDLYLSALPVSVERFSFNTQWFAFEEAIRQRSGRESVSGYGNLWQFNSTLGFSKLFSTGALMLASFANQTVINLTGPGRHTISTSEINLDLVQPLLRGGGRAVTLEPLTLAERNLLYEVRSYARFRKEFFQYITGGGDLINIGDTGGVRVVSPTAGLGLGGAGQVSLAPGAATRLDLGVLQSAISEGFLPTLLRGSILENEKKNVREFEEILELFLGLKEGGFISDLEVDQIKLALLQGRSTVFQRDQDLRDSLDRFKLQLGIPVTVPIELDALPTQPISRHLGLLEEIIDEGERISRESATFDDMAKALQLRQRLRKLLLENSLVLKTERFRETLPTRWSDLEKLADKGLIQLLDKTRAAGRAVLNEKADLEKSADQKGLKKPWPSDLQKRYDELDRRYRQLESEIPLPTLEYTLRYFETQPWKAAKKKADEVLLYAAAFRDVRNAFLLVFSEAVEERLTQVREQWPKLPPLIVDGVDLLKDDLERAYDVVARLALANRLDLMNSRAQLVDSWRQLTVFANSLMGVLNVGYHMDSITPPGQAKPLAFSGSRTRHQLFFNGTLPLVRIAERNAYRASLIAYERARRDLMAFEDVIVNQVRQELRQLRVFAQTFLVQQEQVELAYRQREGSLEEFRAPPSPAGGTGPGAAAASNQNVALVQRLLNAQRNLPAVQNQLFTIWVNYHIVRQQLFLDLELMPLDYRGVWIDEYSYQQPVPYAPGLLPESAGTPDLERQRARILPPS